jgi:hypothetical protein
MNTRLQTNLGRGSSFGSLQLLLPATVMALTALAAQADTSFTATGYVYQVPIPGIWVTNPLSQVQMKGNVHVVAMQGSDPRITGRLQAGLDLAWQTNGTALGGGLAYFEVGTWQNQTTFTPGGGLWVLNCRGVVQADNSDQLTITGYGVGGAIDGLRTEATATRAARGLFDTNIPYLVSGVIKPAPVILTNAIGPAGATSWLVSGSPGYVTVAQNQVTVHLSSPVVSSNFEANMLTVGPMLDWSVAQGHTLETRVKLVQLEDLSASAGISVWKDWGLGYGLFKARDYVVLGKYHAPNMTIFRCQKVVTSNTNVVLILALTPTGQDANLTGRVVDGDNGELLCELAARDTAGSDPSLTADQFEQITGMKLGIISPDPAGPPWTSGIIPALMLQQCFTASALPAAKAIFENFELRTYDIPPVAISRAVRVTVPCPAGVSYFLESALDLNGPWLPVNTETLPGIQTFTVPATERMEFLRPQLAP